jgi:hypothetical protein
LESETTCVINWVFMILVLLLNVGGECKLDRETESESLYVLIPIRIQSACVCVPLNFHSDAFAVDGCRVPDVSRLIDFN